MNSISLASFHFSSDKAGIFLENFFLPGALLGDLVRHKTVQGTCTGLDGESVPGAGQWGGRQAEEGFLEEVLSKLRLERQFRKA